MREYFTVAELIEKLTLLNRPNDTVGVRASCCSHAHSIIEVRVSGEDDREDEAQVIIDAAE